MLVNFLDTTYKQSRIFSQNGEDGVLLHLVDNLPDGPYPSCVEIGADIVNGGLECNTAILLSNGWEGTIYDVSEIRHPWCKQKRITVENINEIVPETCGVLSIDVDGNDYWLWKALKKDPDIVIIEYNSAIPPLDNVVAPYDPDNMWDGTDFYGASAGAMIELGLSKGYHLLAVVSSTNLFFVRHDLVSHLPYLDISGVPLSRYILQANLFMFGPVRRHPTYRGPKEYIHV